MTRERAMARGALALIVASCTVPIMSCTGSESAPTDSSSAPLSTGKGLTGQYFSGKGFGTLLLTRTDGTVSFDWGSGSPASVVPADQFSVRWSGQVQPLYSETYRFYTQSDDGVRLWVNGQQVVNNWTDHGPTENSGTIALAAGQKYGIRLEYYERTGGAVAKLSWSSTHQAKQIVPASQLYPAAVNIPDAGGGDSGSGTADTRPDATMPDARPDATLADTRPDTAVGDTRPDATLVDTRPDTTLVDTRPDTTLVDTHPDTAVVDTRPDAAVVDTRPDATVADTRPDSVVTGKCNSTPTLRLVGNKILDTSGTAIVARGPEIVLAAASIAQDIDTAAAAGANAARLLLGLDVANGMTPAIFDTVIGRAVAHNMVLWLSLYVWNSNADYAIASSLGGGNFYSLTAPSGTGTCSKSTPAPCFLAVWTRQWLKDLVTKYQGHVIIDAGQEYIGVSDASTETGRTEWADAAIVNIRWFRSAGYTVPLQIMSNYQGRDLYAIVEKGAAIRAADSLVVGGYPQTMFGWQAYWASNWYKSWQGGLLLGGSSTITAAQAIHQVVVTQTFPIEVGLDNISGDTSSEYRAEMDQAAADKIGWLWWKWNGTSVDCPVDGAACQTYVMTSQNGFAGAVRSTCGL